MQILAGHRGPMGQYWPVDLEVGGSNLGDGKVFISFDAKREKRCREEEGYFTIRIGIRANYAELVRP